MFLTTITPRFSDTDALGHINNTALPQWFEEGRTPIFRMFTPDLDLKKWRLVMAKLEVEFLKEIFYGKEVEIKTYVLKIGNSSMLIGHQAWQEGSLRAKGKTVIVNYDFAHKRSVSIPGSIRASLSQHLIAEEEFDTQK